MKHIFLISLMAALLVPSAHASEDMDRLLKTCFQDTSPALRQTLIQAGQVADSEEASTFSIIELWNLSEDESSALGHFESAYTAFFSNFPDSRYADAADFFYARALLRSGDFYGSAVRLLPLLDAPTPVSEHSEGLLTQLCLSNLSISDLEKLLQKSRSSRSRTFLERRIGGRRLYKRMGVVLPLKGRDTALGQAFLNGLELALRYQNEGWEIEWLDCESDPILAHKQLKNLSKKGNLDLLLLPGEAAYAAAACGFDDLPIVLPWYEGESLMNTGLTQLNASPETYASAMVAMTLDSLERTHVVTLAPATRFGKLQVEAFMETLLAQAPDIEVGPAQWYFPGASDMRRQLENLVIYESAFDSLCVSILFADEKDMDSLLPQLAWANPQGFLLGNSPFLAAHGNQAMSNFADQLFVLADWTPALNRPSQSWLRHEIETREGRDILANEALAFESFVLVMEAAKVAEARQSSLKSALSSLDLPSAYGGRFVMREQSNSHLMLLAWNGFRFLPVSGLQPTP
jgi:hypothetical protein